LTNLVKPLASRALLSPAGLPALLPVGRLPEPPRVLTHHGGCWRLEGQSVSAVPWVPLSWESPLVLPQRPFSPSAYS